MRIGSHSLSGRLIAAPMAGVTDRPFRALCRRLGASFAVSEMVSSIPRLRSMEKSRRRTDHAGESEPRWVQIAGADPREMAEAARYNADAGAQIIDINMGCPAKKVCNRAAGSALLAHEPLVARILDALMIGRASQGNPWIFREVSHYLATGDELPGPDADEIRETLIGHLEALYEFYGVFTGVRVARKHLGWYLRPRPAGAALWSRIDRVEDAATQLRMAHDFFETQPERTESVTSPARELAA